MYTRLTIFAFIFLINLYFSIGSHFENKSHYSGMDGAMKYLSVFGYMDEKPNKTHMHMSLSEMKDSIMDFQEMCSLKQTGELDSATMRMMNMPRCANKDHVLHPHHNHTIGSKRRRHFGYDILDRLNSIKTTRSKRYVIQGAKWHKSQVTYRVFNYTRQRISPHEVDQKIDRAFRMWELETNLRFRRSQTQEVDIEVHFTHGAHGDNYPFIDDLSSTLAHGFYPGSGLGGDIHFNEAIDWTQGNILLYTAVHEIGHAIGLRHSTDQAAIMFPHYVSLNGGDNVELHSDDIAGIREIYGKPQTTRPEPAPQVPRLPVAPPAPAPRPQEPNPIPAPVPRPPVRHPVAPPVTPTWINPNNRDVLRTTPAPFAPPATEDTRDTDSHEYRARRQSEFCRSGMIDAMITLANSDIYVFQGEQILPLKFEKGEYVPGPILMVRSVFRGKLPGNIDAAFTLENGKSYFFKGDLYWRSINNEIDAGYPKKISVHFPRIPDDVDGAFVWSNNQIYFFKESQYWKFNLKATPQVSLKYPMEMDRDKNWQGIPGSIDTVFRSPQRITYFFKTGRYWRFNDSTGAVAVSNDTNYPYPRDARVWWFSCTEFKPKPNVAH